MAPVCGITPGVTFLDLSGINNGQADSEGLAPSSRRMIRRHSP